MDDVLLADFDYAKLDAEWRADPLAPEQHGGVDCQCPQARAEAVDIGYVRAGELHRVQASKCVLACYNMIIPHIMPELPRRAEAGARARRQDAAGLRQRRRAQLACLRQARGQ
jgi:spermidine dehydrogenase